MDKFAFQPPKKKNVNERRYLFQMSFYMLIDGVTIKQQLCHL